MKQSLNRLHYVVIRKSWQSLLDELSEGATPLEKDFFRSVEIRFAYPDDVISGKGARLKGGRFAPPGVRAVFLSSDEETAMMEVTAHKQRLGGLSQIGIRDYPRVTYIIHVRITCHVDLAAKANASKFQPIVKTCLQSDLRASQKVGNYLRVKGVQGIIYPSPVPGCSGNNLIIFNDTSPRPDIEVLNRDKVIKLIKKWANQ